jgi:hypothetical protein
LIKLWYPTLDNNFIFNCNLKLEEIDNVPIKNKFWKDLIKYFFELKFRDELNLDSVIWYNSHLKLIGKNIFCKERFDKGILLIRYLLNDNNIFKTLEELKDQYDCRINYWKYFSLISIIKSKTIAKKNWIRGKNTLIYKILNSKSLSKEIYHLFKVKDVINIDSINRLIKWKSEVGEINLENVFENISLTTNDFKLRNFQYKLLDRILPTNVFLIKIGIKESDQCNFCNNATDSIFH